MEQNNWADDGSMKFVAGDTVVLTATQRRVFKEILAQIFLVQQQNRKVPKAIVA